MKTENLADRIKELEEAEITVETNEGTFSPAECRQAIGTGDPTFGNYSVLVGVASGERRVVGCDPARAPGYARKGGYAVLTAAQKELRELRAKAAK